MQKRITLFVLSMLIAIWGNTQVSHNATTSSGLSASIDNLGGSPSFSLFPPTVHVPIDDGEGNLIFSWEAVELPANCMAVYELNIYDLTKDIADAPPLFAVRTEQTEFKYGMGQPVLIGGKKYKVVVNAHVLYPDHTAVINGHGNAFIFEHIPNCVPPSKIKVSGIGIDNFNIAWSGPDASPGGIQYVLRYRAVGQFGGEWEEVVIAHGTDIPLDGLDNRLQYEVQVKKICPGKGDGPELHSEWSESEIVALSSVKSLTLPSFVCGDPYVPEPCTAPYATATEILLMDTLYIGGFPILIEALLQGNTAEIVYGTGWVPLPFGEQVVKVAIGDPNTLLRVNEDGHICSGTVVGIQDDPMYIPDLNPGPIAFGGQICIPLPSAPGFDSTGMHNVTGLPWDENGFGPTGTYDQQPPYSGYGSGDPIDTSGIYDPWGFDVNGIHWQTQSTENPYGCTQEQLNSQPQPPPCDSLPPPYYWVDTTGTAPSQAGNELANEVSDSLQIWLEQILTDLENEYTDSINAKGPACDAIRTSMNTRVSALGLDRKYLFGPGDEYFALGMHENFTEEPKPLEIEMGVGNDRDPNQEALEEEHIDLYYCDRDLHVFIYIKDILTDFRTNWIEALADDMEYLIERFSEEEAELYTNRDSLYNWLILQIKLKSNEVYHGLYGDIDTGGTDTESLAKHIEKPKGSFWPDNGNMLAGIPDDGELSEAFLQAMEFTKEDLSFQFRQGWKKINGVHRAYYLEALDKGREKMMSNLSLLTEHDSTLMPIVVGNRGSDGRLYKVYLDNI